MTATQLYEKYVKNLSLPEQLRLLQLITQRTLPNLIKRNKKDKNEHLAIIRKGGDMSYLDNILDNVNAGRKERNLF